MEQQVQTRALSKWLRATRGLHKRRTAYVTHELLHREHQLFLEDSPITSTKHQLRAPVTNWLTMTRGYKCTVSDMWAGPEAAKLDKVASNDVLWHTGGKKTIYRIRHVLRSRFLEILTRNPYPLRSLPSRRIGPLLAQQRRCHCEAL